MTPTTPFRFDPSFFRLLSPGTPYCQNGEVLNKKGDEGALFCLGIFVVNRKTLLLGYDISQKDFITGRDRNSSTVEPEILRACILPLIQRASEDDDSFMPSFLQKIQLLNGDDMRVTDEVNSLLSCPALCQQLAECFKSEHVANALPCRESEHEQFKMYFKNREAIVVQPTLVDLLRKGGYRDIEAEFVYLFSDNNKVEVDEDGETLLKSSLFRLNSIEDNFKIQRESLVFIDSHFLSYNQFCQLRDETYYVSNEMLSISGEDKQCFLRASNRLGHAIASGAEAVREFGFRYSEGSNSQNPWYYFPMESREADSGL